MAVALDPRGAKMTSRTSLLPGQRITEADLVELRALIAFLLNRMA